MHQQFHCVAAESRAQIYRQTRVAKNYNKACACTEWTRMYMCLVLRRSAALNLFYYTSNAARSTCLVHFLQRARANSVSPSQWRAARAAQEVDIAVERSLQQHAESVLHGAIYISATHWCARGVTI